MIGVIGMRNVNLDDLLEFQENFVNHTENIQELVRRLNIGVQEAQGLLKDDISTKKLHNLEEICSQISYICNYCGENMGKYAYETRKQIEEFEHL